MSAVPVLLSMMPPHPSRTIHEVIEWYIRDQANRNRSEVAWKEVQRVLRCFLAYQPRDGGPPMGERLCEECRAYNVMEFLDSRPDLKANTVRRWKCSVTAPFNAAARAGYIDKAPFVGVRVPLGDMGRDWTDDEYRALLRAATPEIRRIIVFIVNSGARQEDVRQLQWSYVDVDKNVIRLPKHKTFYRTKQPRKIVLNGTLIKLLLWILRRQRGNRQYVFLNNRSQPWKTSALTKRFRDLRRAIGLGDDVTLHGGRHFYATRALMTGLDLATVAQLLGHVDINVTKRYLHLADKSAHLNAAAEAAVRRNGKQEGGKP